jgi:uncharacterized protein (DUF2267 family)
MVVLDRDAPVIEAARAIEGNNIGAVVVQHKGTIAGIVTDRDLAIRALGRGLDPRSTAIGEVMTPDVVTLGSTDSQSDAVRLMQERNCRRIPLVDGGRVVGMVTLDDLLLDEAVPLAELAAIVESQIGEGGPIASPRLPSRARSLARAEATYRRMLSHVRARTGLDHAEDARTALETVLAQVLRRLTPDEARDLTAQLPSLLQEHLRTVPPGPDKSITLEGIERELASRLGADASRVREILAGVGAVVVDSVSKGEMDDVRIQLPAELRGIFRDDAPSGQDRAPTPSRERVRGPDSAADAPPP